MGHIFGHAIENAVTYSALCSSACRCHMSSFSTRNFCSIEREFCMSGYYKVLPLFVTCMEKQAIQDFC